MISKGVTAFASGDLFAAGALADQALELALREGSPTCLGFVYGLQIETRVERGDLAGAEEHFIAGLKFFDDPGFRLYPGATTVSFGYGALNAWLLGRADVARERMARMMAAADANTPFDLAFSLVFSANLRVWTREYEQAEALAAHALELSEKDQFPLVAASSRCLLGRARAELGRAADGIALIRQGIAGVVESGQRLVVGHYTAYLAAAQEREGAVVDALETAEQALRANPSHADTLRLRGELRLKQGQVEPAESDFREAIALARKSGAKALQLRATMSLARLLAKQGRRDEARAMLAEIYNEFTEGFDTPDLKDAKTLLDRLKD
jgi:tetratricopeptide (TPR) repeat protein